MARKLVARAHCLALLLAVSVTACGGGGGGGNGDGGGGGNNPPPGSENRAPVVTIQASPGDVAPDGVAEGAEVTLLAVASDPDGDAITFAWEQLSGSRTVTLSDTEELSFIAPDVGPEGERYAFRVTAADSDGASASATVEFDVHFVNVQPRAVLQVEQTEAAEQTVVRFDATGSNDPDGRPLRFHWEQVENGMPAAGIVDNGDGTADVTLPDIDAILNGAPLRIRVTVDDESGALNASAFMEAELAVLFVNAEPQLIGIGPDRDGVDEGVLTPGVTLVVDAFDPDGDALSYAWEVPGNFTADGLNSNALTLLETPNVGVGGETFTFRVHVSDSLATPVFTTSLTVNFVNQAPEITAAGSNGPVVAGENVVLTVAAGDADGQALDYEWRQDAGDAHRVDPSLNPDGSASFTAPDVIEQTDLHFMVIVNDGELQDSESVTVRVNPGNAPPVVESVEQSATEVDETDAADVTFTVTVTDDNTAAENLVYTWDVPDAFAGMIEGEGSNQLRVNATPNVTADTNYRFSVSVRDEADLEAGADFELLVRFVNSAPRATLDVPAQVNEGDLVTLSVAAEDDDEQVLSYLWQQLDTDETRVTIENAGSANATFSAPPVGVDTMLNFTLTVDDQSGADNAVVIHEFQINVLRVNEAPRNVQITAAPEIDTVLEGLIAGGLVLTASAEDDLPESLSYEWGGLDGFESTVNGNQVTLTETPDVSASTPYTISVTVRDVEGVEANGTFELEVVFLNQSPSVPTISADPAPSPGEPYVEGTTITLTAASTDPDAGQTIDYVWSQTAGSPLWAGELRGAQVSLVPSVDDDVETFTLQVAANDGAGGEAVSAAFTFQVRNVAPVPSVALLPTAPDSLLAEGFVYGGVGIVVQAVTENFSQVQGFTWSQSENEPVIQLPAGDRVASPVPDVVSEIEKTLTVRVTGENEQGETVQVEAEFPFTIRPRPADMPLPFSFQALDPVPVARSGSALVFVSDPVLIQGLGTDSVGISVAGPDAGYSVNGGLFTSQAGVVSNDDEVVVRMPGGLNTEGVRSAVLSVGQGTATFSINQRTSALRVRGVAGGLRVEWNDGQPMQGVDQFRLQHSVSSSLFTLAEMDGGESGYVHRFPLLSKRWGTTTFNSDRYDLGARRTGEPAYRSLLGAPVYLTPADSVDAITYIKPPEAEDVQAGGRFASALAVSHDGAAVVAGSPYNSVGTGNREGRVYIHRHNAAEGTYAIQRVNGSNPNDAFGAAIGLSADGNVLAIGIPLYDRDEANPDGGQVRIMRYDSGTDEYAGVELVRPPFVANSVANEHFGEALALNSAGDWLVVGVAADDRGSAAAEPDDESAPDSGAVYIYLFDGAAWVQQAYLKEGDVQEGNRFGHAVALNGAGNRLFVTRPGGAAPAVYVYQRNAGGEWEQVAEITDAAPGFASNISVARVSGHVSDGMRFLSGTAQYREQSGTWSRANGPTSLPTEGFLHSMLDPYGNIVMLAYDSSVPGGRGIHMTPPAVAPDGAGAIYGHAFGVTSLVAFLKAPNPDAGDAFGHCMAFTAPPTGTSNLFVCAPGEDSDGSGFHPVDSRERNAAIDSGAFYIY